MTLIEQLHTPGHVTEFTTLPEYIERLNDLRLRAAGALIGTSQMLALAMKRLEGGLRPKSAEITDLLHLTRSLIEDGLAPELTLDIDMGSFPDGSLAQRLARIAEPEARHSFADLAALAEERKAAARRLAQVDRHIGTVLKKAGQFTPETLQRALEIIEEKALAPDPRLSRRASTAVPKRSRTKTPLAA